MLHLFLFFGSCKFLTLDIGSAFTKGYIFEDMKQPEIALNLLGRRLTPTYIGFRADKAFNISGPVPISPKEGYLLTATIGDKAIQYIKHRPWSATGHLTNFIDITPEKQEAIAKRFHVNTSAARIPMENLLPMFIQLMARELRPDEQVTGISVSVPTHYSVVQREIIRNAIMATGIYCDVVCDEATAVATAYVVSKPKFFQNHRMNVLFIDIGASSSKAYIYNFYMKTDTSPPEITRKSYAYDDSIGGDDITISLANYIIETQGIVNVTNQEFFKILELADKIKKKLSLTQRVEEIYEDNNGTDHTIVITRKEFNKLCKPLLHSVLNVIRIACRSIYPNEVEIIGGSSRIPYIADKIKEAVHMLNHSLNSDEAIAYGASLITQQALGRSLYRKFIYQNNFSAHSVSIKSSDDLIPIAEYGKPIPPQIVFDGTVKYLPFVYTDGLADGVQHKTFVYSADTQKEYNYTVVGFAQEPLDVYAIDGCNDTKSCETIDSKILLHFIKNSTIFTTVMGRFDSERRLLINRKSIEKLSSRILKELKFNMTVKLFSTDDERKLITETAKNAQHFLEESYEELDPEIFEEEYRKLKNATDIVYNRISENTTMTLAMNRFYQLIQISENFAFFEVPINKSFVGQKNILKLQRLVNESKKFFNNVAETLNNSPLSQDRSIKAKNIQDSYVELVEFMEKVRAMKPYVKKDEEKKEKGFLSSFFGKIREKMQSDTDFTPDVDVIEDDEL